MNDNESQDWEGGRRTTALGFLLLCTAGVCLGQEQQALCPKHIEVPTYPPIARMANVTGKITLTVTIDADGDVTNVQAASENSVLQAHPVMRK